jgi:hypothetical protein
MRLSLSHSLRLQHFLGFSALIVLILMVPFFAAVTALALVIFFKFQGGDFAGSILSGVAGLVLCDLGIWSCLRRRQFLLNFCRWQDFDDVADSKERRALVQVARQAFMEGEFPKCLRLLERALQERPADNACRLNLASCMVIEGKFAEAASLVEVAGDPRSQLRYLAPSKSWTGNLSVHRPFSPGSARRARGLAPLVLTLAALFALTGAILDHEAGKFGALFDRRNGSGIQEKDFKKMESPNVVLCYHDEALAKPALDLAEDALQFDLKFFNLPETQFSAHKIKVFLCDSQKEYLTRSPFASSWEAGAAVPAKNVFYIYAKQGRLDPFFSETVAHELCHICYFQINSGIAQDSWLNEGLARYQGFAYLCQQYHLPCSNWLKENVFKDLAKNPLPFELFLHHRPQELGTVADVHQFYNQGHSMVYVLIQYYGKDAFLKFLHNFSQTQDMNASFAGAYDTIHSLDDLHGIWTLFFR